jgi:hypothetical protein
VHQAANEKEKCDETKEKPMCMQMESSIESTRVKTKLVMLLSYNPHQGMWNKWRLTKMPKHVGHVKKVKILESTSGVRNESTQ